MTRYVRIGLLGCGVVGGSVVEALQQNAAQVLARYDTMFDIVRIAVRDVHRKRLVHVAAELLTDDWKSVVTADDVDIVVEAMGGEEPALCAIRTALDAGKDVVTANKLVLALHGDALQTQARDTGRILLGEASVLGGIPALHALDTYFCANRIRRVSGIVNGTCNYILTRMETEGLSFAEALRSAQALGYAEMDPTLDIDGYDAMYKLQILARHAFHQSTNVVDLPRVGIADISQDTIAAAGRLGVRVKHVVSAELHGDALLVSVGPVAVTADNPLYHVSGVQNVLVVEADNVGQIAITGAGAGGAATASAVVEDLIKVVQRTSRSISPLRAVTRAASFRHFLVFMFTQNGRSSAHVRQHPDIVDVQLFEWAGEGAQVWYVKTAQAQTPKDVEHLCQRVYGVCDIGTVLPLMSEMPTFVPEADESQRAIS